MLRRKLAVVALAALAPAAGASADIFYSNDFESGVLGPEWSFSARLDQAPTFTTFVGRYSENTPTVLNNSTSVTLPRPLDDLGNPVPSPYTLIFDLYCFDRWSGDDSSTGPDKFEIFINTVNVFSHTFSNTGAPQSYSPPTVGPTPLGFVTSANDSIYRDITVPFDIGSATSMTIKFRSDGLTGITNESWGIDNVRVAYAPAPGALAVLGLGALPLARRRRR
jgi:MYXO-CTERM domain-containing protein